MGRRLLWPLSLLVLSIGCAAPSAQPAPGDRLPLPPAMQGLAGELVRVAGTSEASVVRIHNDTHFFKPLGRYLQGLGESFAGMFNPHPYWEWPYRLLGFPLYLLFGSIDFGEAIGSGFFVAEDRVLTNAHVVENAAELTCQLTDGRMAPAEVVGLDVVADLALLRVVGLKAPPRSLEMRSTRVLPGEPVLALGFPTREKAGPVDSKVIAAQRVTAGIVSAVDVDLGNPQTRYVETDTALNPGNSGGPLVGLDGTVVGVATMVGVGKENEGYAVPVRTILRVFDELAPRPLGREAGAEDSKGRKAE